MSHSGIDIARYRFGLARAMCFAGRTLTERTGFFVRIDGGVGEVAPMPGLHAESVDDCIALLRRFGSAGVERFPPSLAFGVSCALALANGEPTLVAPLAPTVGVNALFSGNTDDAARAIADGRFAGYRTVKVKISSADDRATVLALVRGLPESTRLRLDANRALGFDAALALVDGIAPERVDYLEEPLSDPLLLPQLHFATGHAIALDESLLERDLRSALETAPGVTTHVLKPSLHGSLERVRERAERTARQTLRTTLSNAFESAYTLRLLARLATWLPNAAGDHGLGTAGFLVGDPVAPLVVQGGRVSTQDPIEAPPLSFVPIEACDDG
ncbi:MAG: o-succinylbenzoate synthase [Phycisphaerae bacterium]|nr:o-succinylbenzoate synthase [Phycisphaerae bacterium]